MAALVNLGGIFNGSKTILGALAVSVFVLGKIDPELQRIVLDFLQYAGIALLPVGLGDKVRKSLLGN